MGYCYICKRNFANGASLRTHRSKFHREEKLTHSGDEDTGTSDEAKTGLESEAEGGKTTPKHTEDDAGNEDTVTDNEIGQPDILHSETDDKENRDRTSINDDTDNWDTENGQTNSDVTTKNKKRSTKNKKRNTNVGSETKKRRFNPYPPKSKEHHVFKKLSGIHNILETLLKDKIKPFNFISAVVAKRDLFDNFIPHIFANEHIMQKELTKDQFNYVTVVRELKDLSDIHLVLNEAETRDTLLDILQVIKSKP